MLPPNLARALAKGTVMSCYCLLSRVYYTGKNGNWLKYAGLKFYCHLGEMWYRGDDISLWQAWPAKSFQDGV